MAKSEKKILIIQDSREQTPFDFDEFDFDVEVGTLPHGDYSVKYPKLQDLLVVERKTLADFVACCGRERDRFERELQSLRGYKLAYVIGEFNLKQVFNHEYRSEISPNSVLASIARWSSNGIRFLFCDDHEIASYVSGKILQFTALNWIELARCRVAADRDEGTNV